MLKVWITPYVQSVSMVIYKYPFLLKARRKQHTMKKHNTAPHNARRFGVPDLNMEVKESIVEMLYSAEIATLVMASSSNMNYFTIELPKFTDS